MPVQAAVKCRLRRPARSVGPADRPAARPARSHARPAGRLPVRPPVLPGRATAHAFGLLTRSGSRVRRPHRLHAPSRDRTAPHAAQCSHDGLPLAACQPRPACNPYGGGNNLSNTCAPQVRQVPFRYPTPVPQDTMLRPRAGSGRGWHARGLRNDHGSAVYLGEGAGAESSVHGVA